MPYYIKKVKDGYKVCKKDDKKCFSKEPISLETAKKQMKAIGMNEHKGGAKETESQSKKYVLVYKYINSKLKDYLIDSIEDSIDDKYNYYSYVELKKNEESDKPIKNLLNLLKKYKIPYDEEIDDDESQVNITINATDDEKFQAEENIDLDKEFEKVKKTPVLKKTDEKDKNKEEKEEVKRLKEKYAHTPLFIAKFKENLEKKLDNDDVNLLTDYLLKIDDPVKSKKFIEDVLKEVKKSNKPEILTKIKLYNEAKQLKDLIESTQIKDENEPEIETDLEKALGNYKKEQLIKDIEDIIKKSEKMEFKGTDWTEEVKKQKEFESLVGKLELAIGKKKRNRKYKFSKYGLSLNNFKLGDLRDIVKFFKDRFTVKDYRKLNKQQLLQEIEKYLSFDNNIFKLKPYEVKMGEVLKDRYYKVKPVI